MRWESITTTYRPTHSHLRSFIAYNTHIVLYFRVAVVIDKIPHFSYGISIVIDHIVLICTELYKAFVHHMQTHTYCSTQAIKHLVCTSRSSRQLGSDEFNPNVRLHLCIDLKHLLFLVAVVKRDKEELSLPHFPCLTSLSLSQKDRWVL